jgi:3-dehydroquinate dehydratase/shikimate dehydrogenase
VLPQEADEHRLASCLMKSSRAKICVPICVQRASELASAIKRASEVADIIELRLDFLPGSELALAVPETWELFKSRQRSMILTLRPAEFGGARPISVEDRLAFRVNNSPLRLSDRQSSQFWDLEVDLALLLQQRQKEDQDFIAGFPGWSQIICSYHDFAGVPSELEQIYESMAATESRILKIAVQADDAVDCLTIFRLLERAQREGREMIAIAMGQAGIMTRILGPSRGSFLTYASLDDESATAPGQLTAKQLRDVFRIDQIDQETEILGLIGKPVGHSLSPYLHNAAFAASQLNAVYIPFEVRDARQFIGRMAHPRSREIDWNLRGLSVTSPHKSAVMDHLDWIDQAAQGIGAVNTILIKEDGLHGYNTDAPGFISPLQRKFGSLKAARCAIIGAGGGARAALWALHNEGAHVVLFGRDPDKAGPVAAEFGVEYRPLRAARFEAFDLVINATPLGTRGEREDDTPATVDQLRGVRLAYDLVYNPLETRFLREARTAGCETLGGIEMLVAQAVEQFKLWTGSEPDVEVMRAAALRGLGI